MTPQKNKRKSKSRADREGSVYFNKAKGCWTAQITVGNNPKTGRRIYRYKMAPTKREAIKKLEELQYKYAAVTSLDAEHITLGEWLHKWFHTYVEPKIRENTQAGYLSIISLLTRELGSIRLDSLSSFDIQTLLFVKLKEHYRTAQLCRLLMKPALKKAVKNHLISENPAEDLELPPKLAKREFVKPSHEDWQKLINARTPYRSWRLIMLTEYVTGARISELLALKWENISFLYKNGENGTWLKLSESMTRPPGILTGGALHIGHALISGRNEKKVPPAGFSAAPPKPPKETGTCPSPPTTAGNCLTAATSSWNIA